MNAPIPDGMERFPLGVKRNPPSKAELEQLYVDISNRRESTLGNVHFLTGREEVVIIAALERWLDVMQLAEEARVLGSWPKTLDLMPGGALPVCSSEVKECNCQFLNADLLKIL